MPYFDKPTSNRGFYAAQHYRRRVADWGESERRLRHELHPTLNHFVGGSCAGMVLSWIRRVHTTGNITTSPDSTDSRFLQYRTYFPNGARGYAYDRGDWTEDEEIKESIEEALHVAPTSQGVRRQLLRAFQATGFHSVYRGKLRPARLTASIAMHGQSDELRTYLLTAQSHATALAVSKDRIAYFDPNHGIATLPRKGISARVQLNDHLESWVKRGDTTEIAVTELAYFKGINRRHYQFGGKARTVERGQTVWDDPSDDSLAFLTTLWGETER